MKFGELLYHVQERSKKNVFLIRRYRKENETIRKLMPDLL